MKFFAWTGTSLVIAALMAFGPEGRGTAAPSVWERTANDRLRQRSELVQDAELFELRQHHLAEHGPGFGLEQHEMATLGLSYLAQAAKLLERAESASDADPFIHFRLAETYCLLRRTAAATTLLEEALRQRPPAVLKARILARLAMAYGQTGRVSDEVAAYSEALSVEPRADERARLLANRAEALMREGDIAAAIAGYRDALAAHGPAPTTLWGLAVALDRSGDLEQGLAAVGLARVYDPADKELNGPDWIYVPEYDKFWYSALGHLSRARAADIDAVRPDYYARAVQAWEAYGAIAPSDDRWIDLAYARCTGTLKEWGSAQSPQPGTSAARRPNSTPIPRSCRTSKVATAQ